MINIFNFHANTELCFDVFHLFSETCSCPETLNISTKPGTLDDGHQSLSDIIKNLVEEVCGKCHAYGTTRLVLSTGDVDMDFPVVMTHGFASTGSKFVSVIQVPGLAVIQRKTEPELGAMEKVMGYSVFSSWPIFIISGVLTILAGLIIWALVRIIYIFLG